MIMVRRFKLYSCHAIKHFLLAETLSVEGDCPELDLVGRQMTREWVSLLIEGTRYWVLWSHASLVTSVVDQLSTTAMLILWLD